MSARTSRLSIGRSVLVCLCVGRHRDRDQRDERMWESDIGLGTEPDQLHSTDGLHDRNVV